MQEQVVAILAGVLVLGVAAQWLGWRLRVPAIVFLLGGGLLAGPILGLIDPDAVFGDLLFPTVSVAVAIILFEGSLDLGWAGVRSAGRTVWMLLTVGAGITLVGAAIAGRVVLDIDWSRAVLLASVLIVTGPTVIGPIVNSIGLHGRVAKILEAEGTLIDPLGAILAVLVFEALFAHAGTPGQVAVGLVTTLAAGALVGLAGSWLLVAALRRFLIPDELQNLATLAVVVTGFAVANTWRAEAGLVAVTAMGIALAAQREVPVRRVLKFNETLRLLFISGLFILLGARIEADTLRNFEWRNIAFLCVLVVLVRPLSVAVATMGSGLGRRERVFLALTAPRGIVAASVASVFSLQLADRAVPNSQILVSATFTVIAGTVLLSGFGARPLALKLGLIDRERNTVVILGANVVAREIAAVLETLGVPVRLIDLNRTELSKARMTGLFAQRGSVLAEETWERVELHRAASFLAITNNDEVNAIASRQAASVIGRRSVFQIAPRRPEHETGHTAAGVAAARIMFSKRATFLELEDRLERGAIISATKLTEQFGPGEYSAMHPDALVMFYLGSRGVAEVASASGRHSPRVGETVIAMIDPRPCGSRGRES